MTKNKNWTVAHNNGNSADLEGGSLGIDGRKTIKRPNKMDRKQFMTLLEPGTSVDDTTLKAFLQGK